jgi:LysR family transcriptional regulator, benzoate and cis,cis-muconate-responsive activator of ben and cat genes
MLADMELRQLRYFVAVAETGNISRAAKKIFLSQPALSRQIKALEEEIGQCLLKREAHSIHLTPVGETFLREARELLQHADQMLERIRSAGRSVQLRVGYAPSLASGILSVTVENFTQAHPGARVELLDLSTEEMLAGLEANRLDVVLTVRREGQAQGLKWTPLVRAASRLAVNRKHPFARREHLTPEEVAREPLLIYSRRDYPEYWEMITGWLRAHRQRLNIAGEYDGTESLMAAVESGLGVALVTTRTAHLFPSRAQFKTLATAPKPLCIAAGYRADRAEDKPLIVFVEELRIAAQAFAEPSLPARQKEPMSDGN